MSFIYKLKANFIGHKKEGHFHYKNFLRALKWVPTWYTYMIATKSLLSDWLQCSESQSERSILWLSCRYIMWVLILKLSQSFYNESDLLFHVHHWGQLTSALRLVTSKLNNIVSQNEMSEDGTADSSASPSFISSAGKGRGNINIVF